jgi:glyoxylase-like metal-dependent hydrolase (beta-lactamase superfamily II)
VRYGAAWVLIDAGAAKCERVIQEAGEALCGANTAPAAILLTHDHPDHAGSVPMLAQRWGCPVYVHPDEMAPVTMDSATYLSTVKKYANPLDRRVILPILHLLPERTREAMLAASSFKDAARALDPGTSVPHLPDWVTIPTPGHTPGHVSFFRPGDRVLITGDAVLTLDLNSLWGFLLLVWRRDRQRLSGPPWYTTWSWPAAQKSVASLAGLEPRVLACGHGLPMSGSGITPELRALAGHLR